MLLDIVILPPEKIRQKIGQAAQKAVGRVPHGLIVDNKKFIPHLSLFHIRLSVRRLPELYLALKTILRSYKPQKIRKTGLFATANWVVLNTNRPAAFEKLHRVIVRQCHKLRSGSMPVTSRNLTALEKQYRRQYGSRHVLKFFRPHFTLGRIKGMAHAPQVGKQLRLFKLQFTADTIAICEVNFWHQVTRIIKKFRLAGS